MVKVKRRGWGYLSLAEIFAVWAMVVAWLQLNALNASEIPVHGLAADALPPAPESAGDMTPDEATSGSLSETQLAELAPLSAVTAALQTNLTTQSFGTSGKLTEGVALSLQIAVVEAQPAPVSTLAASTQAAVIHKVADIATAATGPVAPTPTPPPDEGSEEEPPPPDDGWVWETDENGNIIARIESPQVQVRAGDTPVNIWGGLSVRDPDSPESFHPLESVAGQWGSLTLYEDGSWNYVERDDHAPFEPGFSTESFTVESFDGTQAQVVIWLQHDTIGNLLAA